MLGNRSELLHAAFTSESGGSSVVRLDENGKPYFLTTLPDESYHIERMVSTGDGDIYLVGQGEKAGGSVVKIRPEGDVVFNKPIVPATSQTRLNQLGVLPTGELLIGGHDSKTLILHCSVRTVPYLRRVPTKVLSQPLLKTRRATTV